MGLLQKNGKTIDANGYICLKTKDIEKGLKSGVFVVSSGYLTRLQATTHYCGEFSYFRRFVDEAHIMEVKFSIEKASEEMIISREMDIIERYQKRMQKEAEEEIDQIFELAKENIEKEV